MRHIFFLYTFLLLFAPNLQAQESPGLQDIIVDSSAYTPVDKYRAIGVGYRTSRDEALSPLVFQGFGASFTASSWKYRKEWLWQSAFSAQLHLLKNEPGSSTLSEVGFSYQLTALKELTQLQYRSWRFWIGPEARMLLNTRLHSRNVNNVASYDWASALGVSAMVSTQFTLFRRTFALSNQFQLPLAFVYARPPYAWGIPPAIFEEEEGGWKEAFHSGTLNDILFLENQLNLDFYLKKRIKGKLVQFRAYRLAYSWSYFQVTTKNKVQTGGHELSLSRVLTF